MRPPSEFQDAARQKQIERWDIRTCSICESWVGYVFLTDGVYFDGGCECARGPLRPASWLDVVEHYSRQSDPGVIGEMDRFWGFQPA